VLCQVPGGCLRSREQQQGLHSAGSGTAAVAGEEPGAQTTDSWTRAQEGLPAQCKWDSINHLADQDPGALVAWTGVAWWGCSYTCMDGGSFVEVLFLHVFPVGWHLVVMPTMIPSGWTVCLRVRGQWLWGRPHHPEWLQFLWAPPGHVREQEGP
jgi:hypothetical protein